MRFPLIAVLFSSVVAAQSSLTTLFAADNGGARGNMVYFDLTNTTSGPLSIGAISFNANATPGLAGGLEVYVVPGSYVGNVSNAAFWGAPVASGPGIAAGLDVKAFVPVDSFTLAAGTTYAIAIGTTGDLAHAYTNGNGSNQVHSNADLTLSAGAATNGFFGATLLSPRVANVEIHYLAGNGPAIAATTDTYGGGCYDVSASYYENFSSNNDLGGSPGVIASVRMVPNSVGSYDVQGGSNGWHDNTGPITPGSQPSSTPLVIGDDDVVEIDLSIAAPGFELSNVAGWTGSFTRLYVGSNGYVSIDQGIDNEWNPTSATLLAGSQRWAAHWTDLQPDMQGSVHFDFDGVNCYVTYWNVRPYNVPGGVNSVQIAFYPDGTVEYRYEQIYVTNANYTIGYSSGQGATDPGATDISANLNPGFSLGVARQSPVLADNARPVSGSIVDLTVSRVPASAIYGAIVMSFDQDLTGTDLGSLGMPGCMSYTRNGIALPAFMPSGASAVDVPYAVPPGYDGALVYYQAALLTPAAPNVLGGIVTNGLAHRFGSL